MNANRWEKINRGNHEINQRARQAERCEQQLIQADLQVFPGKPIIQSDGRKSSNPLAVVTTFLSHLLSLPSRRVHI